MESGLCAPVWTTILHESCFSVKWIRESSWWELVVGCELSPTSVLLRSKGWWQLLTLCSVLAWFSKSRNSARPHNFVNCVFILCKRHNVGVSRCNGVNGKVSSRRAKSLVGQAGSEELVFGAVVYRNMPCRSVDTLRHLRTPDGSYECTRIGLKWDNSADIKPLWGFQYFILSPFSRMEVQIKPSTPVRRAIFSMQVYNRWK